MRKSRILILSIIFLSGLAVNYQYGALTQPILEISVANSSKPGIKNFSVSYEIDRNGIYHKIFFTEHVKSALREDLLKIKGLENVEISPNQAFSVAIRIKHDATWKDATELIVKKITQGSGYGKSRLTIAVGTLG